jgi:DNA-binding winged helix-turn-helix (wHTH) protein/TolB-like protein
MIRFADFCFDPVSGELTRGAETERLAPQVARVLGILLERPGDVITREELRQRVWPNVTVEFDQGLNFCVRQLRIALDDNAEHPRFVETLPKRGYRFCAPVAGPEPPAPTAIAAERTPGWRTARRLAAVSVAIICLAGLLGWAAHIVSSRPPILAVVPFDADTSVTGLATYRDALVDMLIARTTNRAAKSIVIVGPAITRRFRSRTPIDTIHAAIGAAYALSGVIRRRENGFDVFAQLVRASDRGHIWAFRVVDTTSDDGASLGARIADSAAAIMMDQHSVRRALGHERATRR